MREVFNETVVDILFYLSKQYRHKILSKVASEAKRFYEELYQEGNNPRFKGKVSWVAHSLGTAISYDLLARQWPNKASELKSRPSRHIFDDFQEDS